MNVQVFGNLRSLERPLFPRHSTVGRMWPERKVEVFSSGEGKGPTSEGEQRTAWFPGGCQTPSINALATGPGGFFYIDCLHR